MPPSRDDQYSVSPRDGSGLAAVGLDGLGSFDSAVDGLLDSAKQIDALKACETKSLPPGKKNRDHGALPVSVETPGDQTAGAQTALLETLGDYDLLEKLGQGGMGIVFRACHRPSGRIVALKVIRSDLAQLPGSDGAPMIERFVAEARAASRIDHDHLVTVYDIGQADGRHYYSMRYVEGSNLAALAQSEPLSSRQAARYVEEAARGVHEVHCHGILHRDLKPQNILVDSRTNRALVTDFGLARIWDAQQRITNTGAVFGSPPYMSPEQAQDASRVTEATDVYGLGATLYHLITGRPPFLGENVPQTLKLVTEQEPINPCTLNPHIDVDLATICLKGLEKDPTKRYASAGALADDLERYRLHQPIQARPVRVPERAWRWCRRNRLVSAALATVGVLTMAVSVVSTAAYWRESELASKLQKALTDEAAQTTKANLASEVAQAREVTARRNLYTADMAQVVQARDRGDTLKASTFLEDYRPQTGGRDYRTGAWHFAWDRLHADVATLWAHSGLILDVACSADGTLLATAAEDGLVRLWRPFVQPQPVLTIHHPDSATATAISPDKRMIASACLDGTLRIADATTGGVAAKTHVSGGPVDAIQFTADQHLLVVATRFQVRLFEVPSLHEAGRLDDCDSDISALAVAQNAALAAVGLQSGEVIVWDLKTRKQTLRTPIGARRIFGIALSRDGRLVAAGDGNGLTRIWDVASVRKLAEFRNETMVVDLAFTGTPSGSQLLTVCSPSAIRLWHPETGRLLTTVLSSDEEIIAFGHAAEGGAAVIGTRNGMIKVWSEYPDSCFRRLTGHDDGVWEVAISPDAKLLASGANDGSVRLWELETGVLLKSLSSHPGGVLGVAFSPDGRILASVGEGGVVRFWDSHTGGEIASFNAGSQSIQSIAFAPDGVLCATCGDDHLVRIWNVRQRSQTVALSTHTAEVDCVAFSPDGRLLASGSRDGTTRIWDVRSAHEIAVLGSQDGMVRGLSWNPDGRTVAAAAGDGSINIWDIASGQLLHKLLGHSEKVETVRYLPSYGLLISGGNDGIVRVWDPSIGLELARYSIHGQNVRFIAVTPDSRTFVTSSSDGSIEFWRGIRDTDLNHPLERAACLHRNGMVLLTRNDSDGGVDLLHRASEEVASVLGNDHPATRRMKLDEAGVVASRREPGQGDEASRTIRDVAASFERELPPGHTWRFAAEELRDAVADGPESVQNAIRAIRSTVVNEHAYVWQARGDQHAGRGRWEAAYRSFRRLWIYGAETGGCLAAVAALGASDRQRYRQTCEMFLDELEQIKVPKVAQTAAWTAALAPDLAADHPIRVRLAKRALQSNSADLANQRTYGAVLFRNGDFQNALGPLVKASASESDPVRITASLFLTMAYHRSGKTHEALAVFDLVQKRLKNRFLKHHWDDDVIFALLYKEASATLNAGDQTDRTEAFASPCSRE